MPITLKDIAKASGFSVTQVSRALSGYDDVSTKTREHIEKIAFELGYQPNHIARQLQSQRTHTIGIIIPAPAANDLDDFFTLLLKGITYEATVGGYDVLVSAANPADSELETYQRIVGGKRVDGVIVARTYRNDQRIHFLKRLKFPFIVHGRLAPDEVSDFPFIDVDSQQGIALLTEHLIEQGHRDIGIILPPEDAAFTPYRLAGYRQTIEKHGIAFHDDLITYADLTYEGGLEAAETLLQRNPKPTAIIGSNDWMALSAITVAKQHGYVVGETFAVAGYDDIPVSSHANPPLTTIHQPIYDIGKQLTRELIQIINQNDPTVEPAQRLIEPRLIVRESSGSLAQRKEVVQ